ncbi:uncharacterized protein LOC124812064 [Hydra vulgaris]|uniref:uncharacterized protein LOC124812064 n=1 Tax=Hydra vulgaris TaxID=6087 RepID=UPI0032E9E398
MYQPKIFFYISIFQRWVWAYRQNHLLVNLNTNNGVERQNKSFKYFYLQRFKNYSLTGMLTILIEEFFIDKYQSYTEKNFKMDSRYRRYAKIIPNFLINRPRALVKHCLQKISLAGSIDLSKVTMINHGVFSIKNNKENYQINFGNDRSMPNCTCPSWRSSCFPCKHFFAIFRKFPLWQWDALSELYLNSPFLTLDNEENTLPDKINCFQNKETLYATNECDISLPISKNLDLSEEINAKKMCNIDLKKESVSAGDCRELISLIKNHFYEVNKSTSLFTEVYSLLLKASKLLQENTTHESGIPIIQQQHVKNFKLLDLPKKRKKKTYSNRCGLAKDKKIADGKINVTTFTCHDVNVEEEVVIEDMELDGLTSFTSNVPDVYVQSEGEFEKMLVIKDNIEDSSYILNSCFDIPRHDFEAIGSNEMLTDNIINAAQGMFL